MLETTMPVVALSSMMSVRSPGMIVGPIASLLGIVYNMLFNSINGAATAGSLGIAIILFTLIVKLVLFPLMLHQQKSMVKMQMLQPEINKIKAKYAGKTDTESQQRMAYEMQEFQQKNGISMMSGCLPLLIQLPILYALFYIFQNAYIYVDAIGQNYTQIADVITNIPVDLRMEAFGSYAQVFVDTYEKYLSKMNVTFDMADTNCVIMLVNSLKAADWNNILSTLGSAGDSLLPLLETKNSIEVFCGINLVNNCSLTNISVVIPILAALTTFLQTKVMTATNKKSQAESGSDMEASMNMMNKYMTYFMPIMMGIFCFSLPAALGVYWSISNIFGMLQYVLLKKYFAKKWEGEKQK